MIYARRYLHVPTVSYGDRFNITLLHYIQRPGRRDAAGVTEAARHIAHEPQDVEAVEPKGYIHVYMCLYMYM